MVLDYSDGSGGLKSDQVRTSPGMWQKDWHQRCPQAIWLMQWESKLFFWFEGIYYDFPPGYFSSSVLSSLIILEYMDSPRTCGSLCFLFLILGGSFPQLSIWNPHLLINLLRCNFVKEATTDHNGNTSPCSIISRWNSLSLFPDLEGLLNTNLWIKII